MSDHIATYGYVNAQGVVKATNHLVDQFPMLTGNEARLIARAYANLRNSELAFVDNQLPRDEQEQTREQFYAIVTYVINHVALRYGCSIASFDLPPDDADVYRVTEAMFDYFYVPSA